jgi:hypothetical protein
MTVTTRRTRHALARHEDHELLSPDAALVAALEAAAPGTVAARASDRLGFAHDASHYLLVPQAVVTPRDAAQVAALLRVSAARGMPLTFRSGGTSLSGQATNDGVLVDTLGTAASWGRTRPASRPARSAASSPTTPAAWPAAPS